MYLWCEQQVIHAASSIKLLERLGFQCVARVDAADYFKGQTSNEYVYELRFTSTAYAT